MGHIMAAIETTTMHDHGAMTSTTHDHGAMTSGSTMHDHSSMMGETTMHDHGGMATDSMGGMTHVMMMQMWFEAGYQVTILFEGWKTETVGAMIGSCFGVFFLAILYEGLKYFREQLHRRNYVAANYSKAPEAGSDGSQSSRRPTVSFRSSVCSGSHYIQTVLHLLQLVISYFLMLIVMTFNVWLFIAVVVGCTVGYFLFGWQKAFLVDITEHCH